MSCMYALRPAFELQQQLPLPTNMYTLSPVNGSCFLASVQDKVNKILKNELGKNNGDIDKRWDLVLEQLQELKLQLAEIRKAVQSDVPSANSSKSASQSVFLATSTANLQELNECVINADPSRPPLSLLLLRRILADSNLVLSAHTHSTTPTADVPATLTQLFAQHPTKSSRPTIRVFIIWRKGLLDPELVVSRVRKAVVVGEVNILRYFARLGVASLGYHDDELSLSKDELLDGCHVLNHTTGLKDRQAIMKQVEARLGSSAYLGGSQLDVCDVAVWSAVRAAGAALTKNLSAPLLAWYNRISEIVA